MKRKLRGLPKGPNEFPNFISIQGYKRNSPDRNRPINVIPSGNITMKDVDFPVRGVDNLGNEIVMMPGREYTFPGDYVVETPYKKGGKSNASYNSNWLNKYQNAGEVPPKDNYIEVRSGNTFDDYITNPLINGIARGLDVTGDWLNNTLQSATKNTLETMYNSPTMAPIATRIQYGVRPWLGENIRPIAYPGIFTGAIELTRGALGMNPPPFKDAQGDYSIEEEAWRKALGLQMNPKYIVSSNYKPSKAKNPNAQYYTFNKDVIDPQLLIAEAKRRNLQEGQSAVISSLAPYIRENFMPRDEFSQIDPLQDFTIGAGKDKKGKYISIYDKYDFEGPLNSFITPYEFYDRYYYQRAGQTSPTYFGRTLPTADIVSDNSGTQYPYYSNLTDEEKRFFSSNTPIGRAVRAKAQTGKVGQTYNDLSKAAKTIGKTAAEFTGVPGAVRFSRNPSENLKGALSTIEKTIIGTSPGVPQGSTPYDSKEVEGFFNTLDAAGLASMGAPLVKTGISGAKALPTAARQAGRYVTTQTPLKNTWKLNPRAFKPNPEAYYRMGEGKSFIDDVLQTNKIRAYNENSYANLRAAGKISGLREDGKIVLKAKAFPEADTYWAKGVPLDGRYASQNYGNYMIEASNEIPFIHAVNQRTKQKGFWDAPDVNYNISHTKGDYVKPRQSYDYNIEGKITPSIGTPLEYNPNLIKLYKQDWLRGYKEVKAPYYGEYFHGSTSGNLPFVKKLEGLKPYGELESLGLRPFAGELSVGISPGGINRTAISTTNRKNINEAINYAIGQSNKIKLQKKFNDWFTGGGREQYLKDWGEALSNNSPYITKTEVLDDLHNIRLNQYKNLSNSEKNLVDKNFPVLYGIRPKSADKLTRVSSDIPGEQGITGGVGLDEIKSILVPKRYVKKTQNLFGNNLNVLPMENALTPNHLKRLKKQGYKDGGSLSKAQLGKYIPNWLNFYNWGVADYTDKGDFNTAYYSAKKSGEKEFMWNGKRYNTNYAGTPRQEVGAYGINGKPVNSKDINSPAQVNLYPVLGRYLPGHISASIGDNITSIDYSGAGNIPYGIPKVERKGEKSFNVYGQDNLTFSNKVASLPLGEYSFLFDSEYMPSDWNLFTNNCADNVCDAFGIPRSKGIETPPRAMSKIKEKYPTLDVTGRTYDDYYSLGVKLRPISFHEPEKVLNQSKHLLGIVQSPDLANTEAEKKIIFALQNSLLKKGYKLPNSTKEDGNLDRVLGPETIKALQDWQKKKQGGQINWLENFK